MPVSPVIHRAGFAVVLGVMLAAASLDADVSRSRQHADQMLRKIAVIATHGLAQRPAARRTPVTEAELNSFLAIHARNDIPAGVVDPVVAIDAAGRVTGRALVDLDEVKKARGDTGGFSVMSLLSGRVPVEATGVLRTAKGVGQFQLESAHVSGVPVPKALLQEVVSYYSRSEESPSGIDLEAPFELPVGIREIQTLKGQAIVVQ
jgi:hypothetical protein